MTARSLLLAWVASHAVGAASSLRAQTVVADTLRAMVASAIHPDMRWGSFPDVRADAERLYNTYGWTPIWFRHGAPTLSARALSGTMRYAEFRGLDPRDYDQPSQSERLDLALLNGLDPGALARLDAQLTVNALRYVRALREGRIVPVAAHAELQIPRQAFDPIPVIEVLRVTSLPDRVLDAIEPQFVHYDLLKRALGRMRSLERDSGLVPVPRPVRMPLRPDNAYAGATRLRRLLSVLGDLPDSLVGVVPAPDTTYDPTLVLGIKRFQRRHGLAADGVMGWSTLQQLNRSFRGRVRQIELSLERWRWLPQGFEVPPIVVNVPAFQLYALPGQRDEEAGVLSMNVVVGRAFDTDTPAFTSDMTYLVFRPYWEVPMSIAIAEVLPKALNDTSWLERNEYELIRRGKPIPATFDNVAAIGTDVRVRQKPGPRNALGLVKFMLPNANDVYLHDTPEKSYFARTRRDLSHGCIRVADPIALAKYVLRDQPDWTDERIRAAMENPEPVTVPLLRPIPVLIGYATAVASETGDVIFYPDIYQLDGELDELLKLGYPFPTTPRKKSEDITGT